MESDLREITLRHLQNIAGISKEHVSTLLILCHILVFSLLERFQRLGIITLYPACFVERDWLPTTLCIIFMKQTVLDNLKLQCSYRTDDLAAVELVCEHLCDTLICKLFNTFIKLLCLHRIIILDIFEHLRRETWQSLEMDRLSRCQCISDFECAATVR